AAESLWRQSRDGRAGLGRHSSAAREYTWGRPQARRRRRAGRNETHFGRYVGEHYRYAGPHNGHFVIRVPRERPRQADHVCQFRRHADWRFWPDGEKWDEYIASQKKIAIAAADAGASVIFPITANMTAPTRRRGSSLRSGRSAKKIPSSSVQTACSATSL